MSRRCFLDPSLVVFAMGLTGCPTTPPTNGGGAGFGNTTDKTNANASFISSNACRRCHSQISDWQSVHGHAFKLNQITGGAPTFPPEGTRAGVANPPEGFDWSDITYVIGGYIKKARFIDRDGFILTTGELGIPTQWNLSFPPNGTPPGFVDYEPERETPKPYDFSCFQCHTTGAQPQDADDPRFQENRAGFAGTWVEAGVQCEACHGPGSGHFGTVGSEVVINTQRIFVDADGSDSCRQCHNRPYDDQTGEILASGGFIKHHEQWPELQASGGHANFACTVCHDPHRSVIYDRENAIRNACTVCHTDQSMALHSGKVYVSSTGYVERLGCESCHMPLATRSATGVTPDSISGDGNRLATARIGDTRTHIFRINTEPVDFNGMFSADGGKVVRDENGMAAVTVDFVCLRCHNGRGNAFGFGIDSAAPIAEGIHELP